MSHRSWVQCPPGPWMCYSIDMPALLFCKCFLHCFACLPGRALPVAHMDTFMLAQTFTVTMLTQHLNQQVSHSVTTAQ